MQLGELVRKRHQKKQLETANAKRSRPICQYGLVRLFLFVAFPMLLVPGLVAAQASDASKGPQGTTPPHYQPITKSGRTNWLVRSVVGPGSLAAGIVSAGWGTAFNNPPEYGCTSRVLRSGMACGFPKLSLVTQSRRD
jgi:hypothetical protein